MLPENLVPQVKLVLCTDPDNPGSAFGPGLAALCKGVRETGSLNAAAKGMGMAYSKAWRLIKGAEAELGIQLLIRDGARGSTLTPEALQLIDAYVLLRNHLRQEAAAFLEQTIRKDRRS